MRNFYPGVPHSIPNIDLMLGTDAFLLWVLNQYRERDFGPQALKLQAYLLTKEKRRLFVE